MPGCTYEILRNAHVVGSSSSAELLWASLIECWTNDPDPNRELIRITGKGGGLVSLAIENNADSNGRAHREI